MPIIKNRVATVYGVGIDRFSYNGTVMMQCTSIEEVKKLILNKYKVVVYRIKNS